MNTKSVPAAEIEVGMVARPAGAPGFPRPDFQEVASVEHDGGWARIKFADGTSYQPRSTSELEVKA